MSDAPNYLLRAAREAAQLTQGQLAERANAQVERATGKPGAMDADYIGKLERGVHRWPNRDYREALCVVLEVAADSDLGFRSGRGRNTTIGSNPWHASGRDDVERKAFLRVLAGSVAGLAFADPLADIAASAATAGPPRRVGQAEVDQVRHMARLFASQDHLVGSGLSAQAVITQLSISAGMLEGQFSKDTVRQQFFAAVAEMADIAGGMSFDAGTHAQAERCFRFSAGCATEAGDWAMRAKALSGLANLAVHQGRADDALSFAEMALVRADRLTPMVCSVMHTRHARALGLSGGHRQQDCMRAVRQAEDRFAATAGDEPAWITYYGSAHLERDLGRALLHLALNGGAYTEAQQRLSAAIDRFPAQPSRGKALATANLAHLTMQRDDPMQAVQLGNQAVGAAEVVRSDRVLEALRQLRAAGVQHRTMPAVRELNQRIDQVLRVGRG